MRNSTKRRLLQWACVPVVLFAGQPLQAADWFARFNGLSSGESTSPGRSGWTDISFFQGGASLPVSLSGGKRYIGKADVSGVVLSKDFDRLSPEIFAAMTLGTELGSVEVDFEVFDGTNRVNPVSITLNDVLIDYCSWSATSGPDGISESVSLVFNSSSYQTLRRNPDGTYTPGNGYVAYYDQITQTGTYGSIGQVAPTINSVPAQSVVRNTSGNSFSFSFSDPDTSSAGLTVDAVSLSESLIPDASIQLTGSGGSRTVMFDAADATGTATIRLTVDDGTTQVNRDVTVYVVNGTATPTLNGPLALTGCTVGLNPFREMTISDPDTGNPLQLSLSIGHGELTLATDIPGGVTAGEVAGNGTSTLTILSTRDQINTTLADPFGLLYATLSNANTDLTLTLTDTDPGATFLDGLVIPVVMYTDPFAYWQTLFFTEEQLAGGLATGELDDFDKDGVLNLIECATGRDPTNPGDLLPMTVVVSGSGEDRFLNVTYRRLKSPGSILYGLELYNTVTREWFDGTAEISLAGTPESIDPRIESVTFRVDDPLVGPATLVRLRITQLP
jgi:type VI protein secretion system component Hcp